MIAEAETLKLCTGCGVEKPVGAFYSNLEKRTGKRYPRGQCKTCQSERRARERQADLESARRRDRDFWLTMTPEQHERRLKLRRSSVAAAEYRARYNAEHAAEQAEKRDTEEHRAYSREQARRRRLGRDELAIEYADVLLLDPCSYCGAPADTIDHIEPVIDGGTNEWCNLTAACASCNSSKHARPLLIFLLRRAT